MISIITPVYNGERFIEFCIRNIIEQNCIDVEHIIVDGCSTDRTVEIIKEYAEKYPHIHWISEKDKGQSDAMNKGIAMAGGEIIGFLNVDDFYEPGVLNRAVELFKALPEPSLLVGNCNLWDDEDKIIEKNMPSKLKITDLMLGWFINQFPVNPSQYFYHKSLHDKIGLYKVEDDFAMDLDFILRAVQAANVKYVNEFWGNYRFFKGTKTYEETQMGRSYQRCVDLLNNYRKELSVCQIIDIKINEGFYMIQNIIKKILHLTACYLFLGKRK